MSLGPLASSRYLLQKQEKQGQLLKQLIYSTLPEQDATVENVDKALAWAIANVSPKHNSFQDADSKDLLPLYEELAARMDQHSQMSKAATLRSLVGQLQRLNLPGAQHDMTASLLSLLFNLARKPLDSQFDLTSSSPAAKATTGTPAHQVRPWQHAQHTADSPESHDSPGSDSGIINCPSVSDLSDWGDESDQLPGRQSQLPTPQPTHQQPHLTADAAYLTPAAHAHVAHVDVPVSHLLATDTLESQALAQWDDLVPCLIRSRLKEAPFAAPKPEQCWTDQYLTHQVCNLLATSASTAFTWAPARANTSPTTPPGHPIPWALHSMWDSKRYGAFTPLPCLHTPQLSQSIVHDMLGRFAYTASQLAWLRALVRTSEAQAMCGGAVGGSRPAGKPDDFFLSPRDRAADQAAPTSASSNPPSVHFTATARALMQAVSAQMQALDGCVVQLQEHNRYSPTLDEETGAAGGMSLLQLHALLEPVGRRVQVLHDVLAAALKRYARVLEAGAQLEVDRELSPSPTQPPLAATLGGTGGIGGIAAGAGSSAYTSHTVTARSGAMRQSLGSPDPAPLRLTSPGLPAGLPPQRHISPDPALASSAVVDVLGEWLERVSVQGGPAGQVAQQQVLHLMCCTLEPLLTSLQAWLYEGTDGQTADDFFIASCLQLKETDAMFWSHAYRLITAPPGASSGNQPGSTGLDSAAAAAGLNASNLAQAVEGGGAAGGGGVGAGGGAGAGQQQQGQLCVACPAFLQPLVHDIYSAGKSLRLLRNGAHQSSTSSPPHSSHSSPSHFHRNTSLLRSSVTQSIHHLNHFPNPSCAPASTTFRPATSLIQAFQQRLHSYLTQFLLLTPQVTQPTAAHTTVSVAAATPAAAGHSHSSPVTDDVGATPSAGLPGRPATPLGSPSAGLPTSPYAAVSRRKQGTSNVHGDRMAVMSGLMCDLGSLRNCQETLSAMMSVGRAGGAPAPTLDTPAPPVTPTKSARPRTQDTPPGSGMFRGAPEAGERAAAQGSGGGGGGGGDDNEQAVEAGATPGVHITVSVSAAPVGPLQGSGLTAGPPAAGLLSAAGPPAVGPSEAAVAGGAGNNKAAAGQDAPPCSLMSWHASVQQAMLADVPSMGWTSVLHAETPRRTSLPPSPTAPVLPAHPLLHTLTSAQLKGRLPCLLPRDHPHIKLAWLLAKPCVDLPPASQLLNACLVEPIKAQVLDIEQELLACLMSEWGLMTELRRTRNLYLLSTPAAVVWSSRLLESILNGKGLQQHTDHELMQALQEACQECPSEADLAMPRFESLRVVLDKQKVLEGRAKAASTRRTADDIGEPEPGVFPFGGLHSVMELQALVLDYRPSWTMSILGGAEILASYNKALVFLLQIKAARMALQRTRHSTWKHWQVQAKLASKLTTEARVRQAQAAATQPQAQPQPQGRLSSAGAAGHRPQGLSALVLARHQQQAWSSGGAAPPRPGAVRAAGASAAGASRGDADMTRDKAQLMRQDEVALQEMLHFVTNLHQYVVDRLLHGAWVQLEQNLEGVTSLNDMIRYHQVFIADLEHHSGKGGSMGPAGTWRHLLIAIVKILDQVVRYCAGQQLLMQQLQVLWASVNEPQVSKGLEQSPQERILAARQQMQNACRSMRHLCKYVTNFINSKTTKIGGDTELLHLVERIQFNDWMAEDA